MCDDFQKGMSRQLILSSINIVCCVHEFSDRTDNGDFLYNRKSPKNEELEALGLKCIPGRTVIRVEEKRIELQNSGEDDDEEDIDTRRTHMNAKSDGENCQVCVCSVEGKDEYCSRRPARNVNECIRMSMIKEEFERHRPFSHERSLAFRIRRDYIWHDDEIPYESRASCRRGRSYYSNSVTANDTDIDVASDIDSLLDYSNKDICYYCVCSVDGKTAGCISRDPVFCEYYRIIRYPDAARDRYRQLFQQDRPAYFRTLSYRLRRMMDEGIFELMENGGDTLCCDHPNGHRRHLHEQVRNKIRLMRRKVPKENIMSGSPGVGSDLVDAKCIPFVSEYSDCSAANMCTGCKRCSCDAEGNWTCRHVSDCPLADENEAVDDLMLENALDNLYSGMEIKKTKGIPGVLAHEPAKPAEDLLLVPDMKFDLEGELKSLLARQRRSISDERNNATVKFYETVDEVNEDTLKSSNLSGTLKANKIKAEATSSRRAGILEQNNASDLTSLRIKYNEPHEFEHHVAENKVDSKHPLEDKINGLSHEEIHRILGNYSQNIKNNDLSKLVVNEMMRGSEVIGDKNVPPLSNITFTPENDTLTAMAFIAGNLLNKLWDMEKDAGEESFETEEIKHKKINDLLELFKEPLSIRQESFLKNTLEKLSRVIDSKKDVKNVSFCTNFEDTDITKPKQSNCTEKPTHNDKPKQAALHHSNKSNVNIEKRGTTDAVKRINDVLNLIKKYEHIQNSLGDLKNVHVESNIKKPSVTKGVDLSSDENISLNLYGNILSKIANLLSPEKKFKTIMKKINSYHMLRQDQKPKKDLQNMFGFDLENQPTSAKDKLITDYLSNMNKHPNCFFSNLQTALSHPNIEGNILYNLSEFLKIKSFTDLLNLVKDKSENINIQSTTAPITTKKSTIMKQSTNNNDTYLKPPLRSNPAKLISVKEKLKNDLKSILQDLVELQTEHGLKPQGKINIADALPCIYNILNSDENMKNKAYPNSIEKIKSFMDALKSEMKYTFSSRRSNVVITQRPKSAVVWERAIKNLDKQNRPASRRSLSQDKKSYKELKNMMDEVELSSNSYKNSAIQRGVAPSERLFLLKTLKADLNRYTKVLENINKSLETVTNLPVEKQNEFNEFVDNAAMNINLNKKVLEVTEKARSNSVENINPRARLPTNSMYSFDKKQSLTMPKWMNSNEKHDFKLRRDEIVNQLIINRLKLYIKTKENSDVDFSVDVNYNLAKRILYNLEIGNSALAKELFKVFMANKKPQFNDDQQFLKEYKNPADNKGREPRGPSLLAFREPLVRVEDPKRIKMLSEDYIWKQLWNLKDLKDN